MHFGGDLSRALARQSRQRALHWGVVVMTPHGHRCSRCHWGAAAARLGLCIGASWAPRSSPRLPDLAVTIEVEAAEELEGVALVAVLAAAAGELAEAEAAGAVLVEHLVGASWAAPTRHQAPTCAVPTPLTYSPTRVVQRFCRAREGWGRRWWGGMGWVGRGGEGRVCARCCR